MHFILGSQSPRRSEILSYFSLPFEAISPDFDENSVLFKQDPIAYAIAIAEGKGHTLYKQYPQSVILTADTVVYCNEKVYGKPNDRPHAIAMLEELAGKWHSVFTGVSLRRGPVVFSRAEETKVLFNALTQNQIKVYCDKLHLFDKAGSYQIQMPGGIIVHRIEGCYYNVMGLPINCTRILLKEIGIELWDYIRTV